MYHFRNRGASHGRVGSLSVAETLRAGTVPGVSSPVLRSSASGVAGMFGGARKVEVRTEIKAGRRFCREEEEKGATRTPT